MSALAESTRDPFLAAFGRHRGQGPWVLADPDGGPASEQAAALILEAWRQGHRTPFFAALRDCRAQVKARSAPALEELIAEALFWVAPWEEQRGLGFCQAMCDLAGTHLAGAEHIVEDEHGTLHTWPEGRRGPRALRCETGYAYCGAPLRAMRRAPRGEWALHGARRCRDCSRVLLDGGVEYEDRESLRVEMEEWSGWRLPFEKLPVTDTLSELVAQQLWQKLHEHPERAASFDRWAFEALDAPLREAIALDAASRADQRPMLARALSGRFESPAAPGSHAVSELARSLREWPPTRAGYQQEAARFALPKSTWRRILPRASALADPQAPGHYAAAVERALARRLDRAPAHGLNRGQR